MMKEYKDFEQLQRDIRESFDPLLSVRDVRHILACSAFTVIDLIKSGRLEAHHIDGTTVDRERITYETYGLRVLPSSLRDYLEATKVK
jgi:hypothetical protein